MTDTVADATAEAAETAQAPDFPMIWVLIVSELAAFALLLGAFVIARLLNHASFAAGQASLDPIWAGLNTLVLITSGWCAARGGVAAKAGARCGARRWLAGAITLGAVFVAFKLVEYGAEFGRGLDIDTDLFAMLYVGLTGFHALHVVLGMVILAVVGLRAEADTVAAGTSFWHMVDLIWLLMFPIIYLVP